MAQRGRKKKTVKEDTVEVENSELKKEESDSTSTSQKEEKKESTSSPKKTKKTKKEDKVSFSIDEKEMEDTYEKFRLRVINQEKDFLNAYREHFQKNNLKNKRPEHHVRWLKKLFKERPENQKGQEALLEVLGDFCTKGILKSDIEIVHIHCEVPWSTELIKKYLPKAKITCVGTLKEPLVSSFLPKEKKYKYIQEDFMEDFVKHHGKRYDVVFSECFFLSKESLEALKKDKKSILLYNNTELSVDN